jgi:uncharacterized protein (DUF1800 family)
MISARLVPIDPERFGLHEAAHLLRRSVVGARPSEVIQAQTEGLPTTLDRLFLRHTPDTTTIEHLIGGLINSEVAPNDSPRGINYFEEKDGRYTDFRQWWSRTMIEAPLSIQERMVLLWHMHFATSCNGAHYAEHAYDQNNMMRQHAFGDLRDLTHHVTRGFAMQAYLDGIGSWWTEYQNSVNENHARELLELHVLGHRGRTNEQPYTQEEIVKLARMMSGNHIDESWKDNSDDGTRSLWRQRDCTWRRDRWYPHEQELFGTVGAFTTDDVTPLIFRTRADDVAWWFARRLCGEFCAMTHELNPDDVDAVATLILEHEWDLEAILRVLLASEMFYDPTHRMRLVRPPASMLLGLLRAFRATHITDFTTAQPRVGCDLIVRLTRLGQLLYNPPNVAGWRRDLDWFTATDTVARVDTCRRFGKGTLTYMDNPGDQHVLRYDANAVAQEYGDVSNLEQFAERVSIVLLGTSARHVTADLMMHALGGEQRSAWNGDMSADLVARGVRRLFTQALSAPRYQLF